MSVDTDFLRGRNRMPATRWSRILGARDREGDVKEHLEHLVRSYWRVVYAHIYWRWSKNNEDAKDLTQEFFARFLEKNYLQSIDPARGRFRTFLKASLEHFLRDRRDYDRALKRSGDTVPLDGVDLPPKETSFDQEWVRSLFELGLNKLDEQCEQEGKRIWSQLFRAHYAESPVPTYRDLATRFGVSESDVNNHLHAARITFKEIVRRLVRDTVASPEDLEAELRDLFGSDGFVV